MEKMPETIPQEFYDLVDEFIDQAKKMSKRWPESRVSATLLYAAARFNVFTWMHHHPGTDSQTEDWAKWYARQYKKMFLLNAAEMKKTLAGGETKPPAHLDEMKLTG